MDKQIRKEWQIALIGWSAVIVFLTAIDKLYDLWVPSEHELNNPWYWAIQEWGIWFVVTPLLFRLLSSAWQTQRLTTTRYVVICASIFVIAMASQAVFDLYALNDPIAYTLLYFAPTHPLVIFVNLYIWQRSIKPAKTHGQSEQQDKRPAILIEQEGSIVNIPFDEIVQINSASNYVEICTTEQTWLKRATLKDIEASLPHDMFIRTHRSHLVNIKLIRKVNIKPSGSGHVILSGGQVIALSKAHKKAVKSHLQTAA